MYFDDETTMGIEHGGSYVRESVSYVIKTQEDLESTDIGVFIPRLMPAMEIGTTGEIASDISLNTDSCINSEDFPVTENVVSRNWLRVSPRNLTNITPPRFVKGSIVFINFMDSDIKSPYYSVTSLDYNGHLQTDTCRFFVPASPEPNVVLTKDNMYFVELDSKKNRLIISTNKNNGETCKHMLIMDSKNGVLTLTDEARSFNVSCDDDTLVLKNEADSAIILNKDEITISAKKIKILGDEKITVETNNMEINSDKTTFEGDSLETDHSTVEIDSKTIDVSCKKETHDISSLFSVEGFGKTHIDHSKIGFNGDTIIRNFIISNVPDINVPAMKLNGDSGPPGASLWTTGPGSVPLVKFDTFSTLMTMMCTYIDTALMNPFPSPPLASSTILPQLPQACTKQILGK